MPRRSAANRQGNVTNCRGSSHCPESGHPVNKMWKKEKLKHNWWTWLSLICFRIRAMIHVISRSGRRRRRVTSCPTSSSLVLRKQVLLWDECTCAMLSRVVCCSLHEAWNYVMVTWYKRMTVSGLRNVWILWLKVLCPEVDRREHGWGIDGNMKSLKVNKEDASVCSKWRGLIRSIEGGSDDNYHHCWQGLGVVQ